MILLLGSCPSTTKTMIFVGSCSKSPCSIKAYIELMTNLQKNGLVVEGRDDLLCSFQNRKGAGRSMGGSKDLLPSCKLF